MILKYPSPNSNSTFTKRWEELLPQISMRDNFKTGHLHSLEILCGLYLEYENLSSILELEGYTYESVESRMGGTQIKSRPELSQLNVCRTQIAVYTKMLGLTLAKDTAPSSNTKEKDEWG